MERRRKGRTEWRRQSESDRRKWRRKDMIATK
jgi:hypothetical protein